jgi:hypothetical protein
LEAARVMVLLPLTVAALDWVENGFFLLTVMSYPPGSSLWPLLAVATKTLKVGSIMLCNGVILVLAAHLIIRKLRLRGWQRA